MPLSSKYSVIALCRLRSIALRGGCSAPQLHHRLPTLIVVPETQRLQGRQYRLPGAFLGVTSTDVK